MEEDIHHKVPQEYKEEIQVHGWTIAENGHSGGAGSGCWLLEEAVLQDCSRMWHEQVEKTSWTDQPSHWAAQSHRAGPQVRAGIRQKLLLKKTWIKYLRWMIYWAEKIVAWEALLVSLANDVYFKLLMWKSLSCQLFCGLLLCFISV